MLKATTLIYLDGSTISTRHSDRAVTNFGGHLNREEITNFLKFRHRNWAGTTKDVKRDPQFNDAWVVQIDETTRAVFTHGKVPPKTN